MSIPMSRPNGKPRVLVVDDDLNIARTVQRVLSDEFDVVALTSPLEAFHLILAGRRFSAIVCDIRMPELTGMELHDEIVRIAPRQAKRMIFTTGGGLPSKLQIFAESKGVLSKPFDLDELRRLVAAMSQQPLETTQA
ncbi:MAG: response regulator [Polyangiales bacterium]